MFASTTSAEFFEQKYRAQGDPWNFAEDTYENARYGSILKALEGRRFQSAFEPGCSVGVLTRMIAEIADSVQACDFSPTAVEAARARCADAPNVTVACAPLCAGESWSAYDLVVLSEIGYYFSWEAWQALVLKMCGELHPGATVVACHWLGESPDHILHGDEVHQVLSAQPLLRKHRSERHSGDVHGYRLEVWRRR